MGTPFIAHLEPTGLDGYDRSKPHDAQHQAIPAVFRGAMAVREAVFVHEQGVPLEYEHDADDARSCHWVAYPCVGRVVEPEVRGPATATATGANVGPPRRSETRTAPIGTLRVVPFPHPPHPVDGGWYVDNVLRGEKKAEEERDGADAKREQLGAGSTLTVVDEERQNSTIPFGVDRATTYHDGKEPYVKIGRMAVVSEFRGHKISLHLWRAAKKWLEDNPTFFNPSVTELSMDQLKDTPSDIPKWNGLVCCHAQEQIVKVYERWGFKVDEGMGRWFEEGIPHVGMFLRLEIKQPN
ncbi:acyl-CoA N-acyltransferase [Xylariaceae sp. FL0662B]|nr:acyl-CoA N-acyltransferase [Xylariaceae sp. FL0662B]